MLFKKLFIAWNQFIIMESSLTSHLKSSAREMLSKILGIMSISGFVISFLFFTGMTGSVVGLSRNNIYALISLAVGLICGKGWLILRSR